MISNISLSSPLQLGALRLRNRNVMASLTRNRWDPSGYPLETIAKHYVQRARGGAGLIMSEGALITPQGSEWPHAPGIWSREQTQAWKTIVEAVHAEGVVFFMQLWHVGRISHSQMPNPTGAPLPVPVPAPSPLAAREKKFHFPGAGLEERPETIKDPWEFVEFYRIAALNAKEAGFDGVELHSSGGYFVHEFLDSTSNKRVDEWGGSVEKRCKFGLEILKAITGVWGADRVGVKISPSGGYNDVGMPLEETIATYSYYIQEIDKMGVAYIQLMRYFPMMDAVIDGNLRGTPHDVVETYGSLIKHAKLLLNGDLTLSEANALITAGKIDAAVFGRPWISQPDLQRKWEAGKDTKEPQPDWKTFYVFPSGDPNEGYTDYPFAVVKE
ncbi:FMN-linked oxidoreductase [Auricularia subglabra TFB-10046 SS5]|uniref:FMN-linked oxidoreductase n=1 Tax=Auricularia subglabra (strain TFB-10046 / SS5) TaxID=717982 RepID=J0DCV0_AURST|nr:FMN-linked oxidoreductase [Auricularia subglabra TFB-10046 SS5]